MSQTEILKKTYHQTVREAASLLKNSDHILILSHKAPDGDTLGSAFALCRALIKSGKKVQVECSDEIPRKYLFMRDSLDMPSFEPDFIVSVDIASENLFGEKLEKYIRQVDLCIDHHESNSHFAKYSLISSKAAAACEIIVDVINELNVQIDSNIADCIYTGMATDTGCFRYSNTSPDTLRTAAAMIDKGAHAAQINKKMFETVSRQRLSIELMALDTLEYHENGKIALIYITRRMCRESEVSEAELEGIPSMPVRIEGVVVGITLKERRAGGFKISVRTNNGVNASDICALFGGGGHAAAAGCQIDGSLDEVKDAVLKAVKRVRIS